MRINYDDAEQCCITLCNIEGTIAYVNEALEEVSDPKGYTEILEQLLNAYDDLNAALEEAENYSDKGAA